jgi:hypothetical protein
VPVHTAANPVVIVAETCFESDLEGWELFPGPATQLAWAGDPDGHARFEDASPTNDSIRAPADYLGDWSWMNGIGFLRWDQRVFSLGTDPAIRDYQVVIAGPGGRARLTAPGPAGITGWEPVSAHLFEGNWTVESGTWAGVLAQVDTVLIGIEMVDNADPGVPGDVDGVDNVVLAAPYGAVAGEPFGPTTWTAIKALWSER